MGREEEKEGEPEEERNKKRERKREWEEKNIGCTFLPENLKPKMFQTRKPHEP